MSAWDNLFTRAAVRIWNDITKGATPKQRSQAQRKLSTAMGGWTPHGTNWVADRFEQARHCRAWVYIAARANARHMAATTPQVGRKSNKEAVNKYLAAKGFDRTPYYHRLRTKALTSIQENDEIEIMGPDHPMVRLIEDPNEPDTDYDTFYETELFMGLHGIAYWWQPKNRFGLPAETWVIPSSWMRPRWSGTKWIDYFECRPYGTSGTPFEIPGNEVVMFKDAHPYEKRDGLGALQAGDNWIDTSDTMDLISLLGLRNGAYPTLQMIFDGKDFKEPDDAELERILGKVAARLQGVHNVGNPFVNRPGAKAEIVNSISDMEMGFLNSRPQMRDAILSLFGVPYTAAMIVGGATDENYDHSIKAYHQGTLNPKKRYYGRVMTEKIAKQYDPNLFVFFEDSTPTDPAQITADLEADYRMQAVCPNEIRKVRGREPYQHGGDDPVAPGMGVTPIPWNTGKEDNMVRVNLPEMQDDGAQSGPGDNDGDPSDNGSSGNESGTPLSRIKKHLTNGVHRNGRHSG